MYCINTIKAQNNAAVAKVEAEANTHWIKFPAGNGVISCLDADGDKVVANLDAKQFAKFEEDLGNHDGIKPIWQHRQAVCRKWCRKLSGKFDAV